MKAFALLLVGCAVLAAAWFYAGRESTAVDDRRDEVRATDRGLDATAVREAPLAADRQMPPLGAPMKERAGSAVGVPAPNGATFADLDEASSIVWPVAATSGVRQRTAAAGAGGESPDVAIDLAFQALNFVGVDEEAEKIWLRAINDPKTPAGVRSDLIEDLNDEGYVDNSHPGKEDLELILARMRLIERLAPATTDPVNAAAFAETYKDLLAMYVRLAGSAK